MADGPTLDPSARERGRQRALDARRARAQVKADLADGRRDPADVLGARHDDETIARMLVRDFLRALPGIGPVRADRIISACGIADSRRLSGLGERQEQCLLQALASPQTAVKGTLLVLSGPSGVGKSSVVSLLREQHPQIAFSVSVTTRRPRPGEVDGEHYHFIDDATFDAMVDEGELLEWAAFAGNRYGTPAGPVRQWQSSGRPVLLEIELQGARQVRRSAPEAIQVFLAPPSWETLVARLEGRRTEAPEVIAERLRTARVELAAEPEFDRTVVNEQVEQAADELAHLLGVDRLGRVAPGVSSSPDGLG